MPIRTGDAVNLLGTRFAERWNVAKDLKVVTEAHLCPHAAQFAEWAERLCTDVTHVSTMAVVNQGKILLQDKYFEWRQSVPLRHRNHSGKGHICIYQVYAQTYERLRQVELSLKPILLPEAPPPQHAGIILGQLEEELGK